MEQYLIPALATIIVAVIEAIAAHDRKQAADRAEIRKQESRLSMEMMFTTSEMCDVLCNALQGGKTNGNVEQARGAAKSARDKYENFIREQAAKNLL